MFQFTPLREGRPAACSVNVGLLSFNSRPCVRGDKGSHRVRSLSQCFNSRPCVRGDQERQQKSQLC